MGNTTSSGLKKAFDELDTDHSGNITLYELIKAKNHHKGNQWHFDSRTCSLTTLYLFDAHKAGSLTFKEFVELDRFIQKIAKKVEREHKKKLLSPVSFAVPRNSSGSASSIESADNQRFHHSLSHNSVGATDASTHDEPAPAVATVNREETRMFTSYLDPNKHNGNHANTSTASNTVSSNSGNLDLDEEEDLIQEIKECINAELLPVLKKHLIHKRGREQFLDWLFKVADWKHDNLITTEELDLVLQAVQQDGIDLHSLLFDETTNDNKGTFAQHIMNEYDFLHKGSLTKEEFMTLGEIILRQYEMSQSYERIGPWELTHTLGEGSYGIVKCGIHIDTGERRAVKIIKRGNVSDMSRLDIEIQAMKMLNHPQIVRLENVISTEENVYLIMELCGGGSLYENLTDHPIDEDLARYYFNQLMDGLGYCHSHGVCHRDLRLENLLLDNSGELRITDFGQARIFKKGWDLFSTHLVGSLYHLSPEQTMGQCYSGEKVDIWSAGIILYYFLVGKFPFRSMDTVEMFDCIRHARYEIPDSVSPDAKDLIQRILQVDSSKRPTLDEIKNHPWTLGRQRQPELMQYKIALSESSVANWLNLQGWTSVERILDDLNVYYLANKAPTDIAAKSKSLRVLKCLHPTTDLRFSISLIAPNGESDNKMVIQLNLRDGESKEFRKLVQKLNKALQKQFKLTPAQISIGSCETTTSSSSATATANTDNTDSSLSCSCSSNTSSTHQNAVEATLIVPPDREPSPSPMLPRVPSQDSVSTASTGSNS